MANKPRIRFRGFTEDWEQRKFLDLLDTQNGIRRGPFGSSLKKDSFVKKSDYVVYEQQNAIYDNYVTRYFISKEKYNELIRFNIQPGDFIMSGAGTIGRISMVPDGIKKGVFNQALIRFKVDKNSVNPLYFLKFMQSDMMQKQLTQANPGSAMTNLVPMDELKKWDVTIPSLEEQNKISNFINQIDESITLHQCKLKKLNLAKKSLLQKLFPRNGSQIPGVRFKGFTDAWEQRKLGDVAIITGGGTPSTNVPEYWNGDIDWYSPVEIGKNRYVSKSTRKITKLGLEKSSAKLLPIGTVLFTSRAGIGNTAILQAEGCTNQGFQSITPDSKELDTYFLYTMTPRLKRYGEVTGAGSTFVEVSGKQMEKMSLVLPSLEEQKQIGRFFRTIDDSITLHQRKLERLQEVKKGLLQKMFV